MACSTDSRLLPQDRVWGQGTSDGSPRVRPLQTAHPEVQCDSFTEKVISIVTRCIPKSCASTSDARTIIGLGLLIIPVLGWIILGIGYAFNCAIGQGSDAAETDESQMLEHELVEPGWMETGECSSGVPTWTTGPDNEFFS